MASSQASPSTARLFTIVLGMFVLGGVLLIGGWWSYQATRMYYLARQIDRFQSSGDWKSELQASELLARDFPTPSAIHLHSLNLVTEANRRFESGLRNEAFGMMDRAIFLNGAHDPSLFESYGSLLIKDNRLDAAEFMLGRAAYWQSQDPAHSRPPNLPDSIYQCDGEVYFALAKAAISQHDWKRAARAIAFHNFMHNDNWLSIPNRERNDLIQQQLQIALSDDDKAQLSIEVDSINKGLQSLK